MQSNAVKLTIKRLAQGVGFRPYIRRLALGRGIKGYVQNYGGGAEILCVGSESDLEGFLCGIQNINLPHARIDKIEKENVIIDNPPSDFFIKESSGGEVDASLASIPPDLGIKKISGGETDISLASIPPDFFIKESLGGETDASLASIPPDLGICNSCRSEMGDPQNRRHGHPFISCVSCGPRYTVIRALPYDRCNTSLENFPLCHACESEYYSTDDARSYAQTISCQNCGPQMKFVDRSSSIIAVKGIGGFHLACRADDEAAAARLREIKGREAKPFAVMFPDIGKIREICRVSDLEERLLTSPATPIVLLKLKRQVFPDSICQNNLYCGCFLPYTPLHIMLTERMGSIVLTSANVNGEPIIYKDEEIWEFAQKHNISLLTHDREILRPIDDSVIKVIHGEPIFFRRARGYVPEIFFGESNAQIEEATVNTPPAIAVGGDLKSAFCLRLNNSYCLSQPLGDLENAKVSEAVEELKNDWFKLFRFKPGIAVCDMHPNYFSRQSLQKPAKEVQHHHAHIASVIAEHGISDPVIGVAFDGTGYGADGCVWGGEFLICNGAAFERVAHFAYAKILGGDASAKDAAKTAFCFLNEEPTDPVPRLLNKLAADPVLQKALDAGINTAYSSSVGRLFDAAAYLLGVADYNRFEGECASLLEREAEIALDNGIPPANMRFDVHDDGGMIIIEHRELLKMLKPQNAGALALGFHQALAGAVHDVCLRLRARCAINAVALSGGVFQNKILTEMTIDKLSQSHFETYRNIKTSPNDGSLALGQAYLAGFAE